MSLFENLSDRLNHIFSKLRNKGKLTELEIKQAMREIRVALLEADVNFAVVKDFVAAVSEKALGEDILKSLTPAQQIVKIVNDELVALMGSTHRKLAVSDRPPTVYMMCGLQGAGKTTMCGKLALYLKKQGKRPLLIACDVYRPAAIKQLQIVAAKVNAGFFEMGQGNPVKIAENSVKFAEKNGFDTVIIDTAGRLHVNEELMAELKAVKKAVNVYETLLVVDAMTGQDAVTVAKTFDEQLDISGVIMTKLDGDTRGGATLSIKAVTGKPIKFCGTGEKPEDIEAFHPDRMASRILGMGDVLTLIERAQTAIDEEQAQKLAKKIKDASFDLNDFLAQYDQVAKMGDINDIVGMIPGASRLKGGAKKIDEKELAKNRAIILSMTKQERENPKILNYSRRKRIAQGSGTQVQDDNRLIKQFEQSRDLMKKMAKSKRLPF